MAKKAIKNAKGKAMKKVQAKAPTKIRAGKTATAPVSKADFIRANPNLSPKELVAKAKEKGLSITSQYVYIMRSDKKRGASVSSKGASKARVGRKAGARVQSLSTPATEKEIVRFVNQHGVIAVRSVIDRLEADS